MGVVAMGVAWLSNARLFLEASINEHHEIKFSLYSCQRSSRSYVQQRDWEDLTGNLQRFVHYSD